MGPDVWDLRIAVGIIVGFIGLTYSSLNWAYVPTITASGAPIRWKGPIKLNFAGNPVNQSGLNENSFYDSIVKGLQRWRSASSDTIGFDYWQGTDKNVYLTNSEFNGLSSVYFASNASSNVHLSPNVLGMTQVWYNTESGEILETDIVLNDIDFRFTDNPTDTSGYGSEKSTLTGGKSNVYIQNVITHELGHALGISHSGGLQSTMLFMESPEQAHLGCDEQIAIHALYPTSDQAFRGVLSGLVLNQAQQPMFGAHVLAISQKRGTVLATSITDRAGRYLFQALEPGTYYMMVEPFFAGAQALPSFYATANPSVCPNRAPFVRTFLTNPDGITLVPLSVGSSQVLTVPTIMVHCNPDEGTAGSSLQSPESLQSPQNQDPQSLYSEIMSDAKAVNAHANIRSVPLDSGHSYFGLVDYVRSDKPIQYQLTGISGHLEIHAISYSLYSPVHPTISLKTSRGVTIPTQISDPVYRGESGYINHDAALTAEDLPEGDYILEVTSENLQASEYPAGPISLDHSPFMVILGSTDSQTPLMSLTIPLNARCRSSENFPKYVSPPGPPPRSSTQNETSGTGLCGTTTDRSNLPRPPTPPSAILGWLFPWIVSLAWLRVLIRLQRSSREANLKVWG